MGAPGVQRAGRGEEIGGGGVGCQGGGGTTFATDALVHGVRGAGVGRVPYLVCPTSKAKERGMNVKRKGRRETRRTTLPHPGSGPALPLADPSLAPLRARRKPNRSSANRSLKWSFPLPVSSRTSAHRTLLHLPAFSVLEKVLPRQASWPVWRTAGLGAGDIGLYGSSGPVV